MGIPVCELQHAAAGTVVATGVMFRYTSTPHIPHLLANKAWLGTRLCTDWGRKTVWADRPDGNPHLKFVTSGTQHTLFQNEW